MFITNNHASFHLQQKENLVKYQKISKYYVHYCLQTFVFLFMFLLTAPIVRNSHILAGIYFIFLKKRPGPNLKVFRYQIQTSVKRLVRQLSSKLKFSTFTQSCVKSLIVIKIVQKIKFEGDWGKLDVKNCFQRQSWIGYMRQTHIV